jgi:PhnB protein
VFAKWQATSSYRQWIGYAAACWALIFAAFHVVWATGRYVGLDPAQAEVAFAVPWKRAYNLIVIGTCLVGGGVALALVMPWGRSVPRRLLGTLAWTGTLLLVVRALASLVQAAYLLWIGRFRMREMGIWEPWFYLGAMLFVITLWQWRRKRPRTANALSISVMLAVPDASAAADWYKRALGAAELWNLGSVVGLDVAGAPVFVGQPEQNAWESPSKLGITTTRIEVFCDDPDAFIARAIAAGANGSLDRVRNHAMPWGPHRQGGFVDPFGHIWLVGDHSPLSPHPRVVTRGSRFKQEP